MSLCFLVGLVTIYQVNPKQNTAHYFKRIIYKLQVNIVGFTSIIALSTVFK